MEEDNKKENVENKEEKQDNSPKKENNQDKTPQEEGSSNKENNESLLNKVRENYWIVATIVLGVLLVALLFGCNMTGKTISQDNVEEKINDFLQAQTGGEAELQNISDFNDYLYEATISLEGQQMQLHITKDGEHIVQGLTPLEVQDTPDENTEPTQNTQESSDSETDYSDADLEKLTEFNDCLAENEMVIYGSETCPHCSNLVSMLGGYDVAEPVYVECTEEQQRCSEEAETDYVPEIQIDGEIYEGEKTIEGFASETGCEAPDLE